MDWRRPAGGRRLALRRDGDARRAALLHPAAGPCALGDFVHREVFSRTRSSLDVAMSDDVGRLDAVAHPQHADQAADRGDLRRAGRSQVEVAHDRNPDAVFVVLVLAGVGSLQLLTPAEGRLDFAVAHAVAVTHDEVIADAHPVIAVLVAAPQVGLIDAFDAPAGRGGVVQDDVSPLPRRNVGPPGVDGQGRRPIRIDPAADRGLRVGRWQHGRASDHAGICRFNVGWKRCRRHPSWLKATHHHCAWCRRQPKDPYPPSANAVSPPWDSCRSIGPAEVQSFAATG